MKILLVSENKDLRELLSFQISSKVPVRVKECNSARDAVDLLNKKEETFQLVVGPYNGPESSLLQCLRTRTDPLPIVLFYDSLIATPDSAALGGLMVLGTVEHSKLVEGVVALVQDFHTRGGEAAPDGEFCPIRTTLLIRATPLKSDIYIRLSKDKFLKLFRTGDDFDAADLEKYYESKGVEYMYLRRLETAEFLDKFRRDLDAMLAKPDLKPEEAAKAVEMNQDTIQELVHKVGFTEEVQELAKKNVALTLKSIGTQPRLVDVLTKVTSGGNYLSNHSTLLAHLACCVAKEMQWGSESTFTKLILASYMHDISLSDQELAKMQSLEELEDNRSKFPDDQVKGYHLHPARSADVVRSFKEIPADVDLIVQQHHERPNGSGFPRGLAHNYIAPLSALFVIAHDLTRAILDQPGHFSLQDFVDDKKPLFSQGNFKKVMAALEKASLT